MTDGRRVYHVTLPGQAPTQGTLVYLAGGPLPHATYVDLARYMQTHAVPHHDVLLYDYVGLGCSSQLTTATNETVASRLPTMTAMADDLAELLTRLGLARVDLMGGSHGGMLGAQVLASHGERVRRAVLFSGDTQSGWLPQSWARWDARLARMADDDPRFGTNLSTLFTRAEQGVLRVPEGSALRTVTRAELEFDLWLVAALSSVAQAQLPRLVEQLLTVSMLILPRIEATRLALRTPMPTAGPSNLPVLNVHRCNVWWPAPRVPPSPDGTWRFLDARS